MIFWWARCFDWIFRDFDLLRFRFLLCYCHWPMVLVALLLNLGFCSFYCFVTWMFVFLTENEFGLDLLVIFRLCVMFCICLFSVWFWYEFALRMNHFVESPLVFWLLFNIQCFFFVVDSNFHPIESWITVLLVALSLSFSLAHTRKIHFTSDDCVMLEPVYRVNWVTDGNEWI